MSGTGNGGNGSGPDRIVIRAEAAGDAAGIHAVHAASFPSEAEARLVDALRHAGRLAVSLLAHHVSEGTDQRVGSQHNPGGSPIVGHVAFSPVAFAPDDPWRFGSPTACGMGLAPVAVLEEHRRQGIGAALIRAGIEACRGAGCDWIVVLGAPTTYSRFGFRPARERGLRDEYDGGDAFQVLVLREHGAPAAAAVVRYAAEFGGLTS